MSDEFTIRDFLDADGVENWRVISDGACAFYHTGSFAESAGLVDAIAGSTVSRAMRRTSTSATTG